MKQATKLLAKLIGTSESNVRDFMGVYDYTLDDIEDNLAEIAIAYLVEEGFDGDSDCVKALVEDGYCVDYIDACNIVTNEFVGKFNSGRDFASHYLEEFEEFEGLEDMGSLISANIDMGGVWDDLRSNYNYVTAMRKWLNSKQA